MIDIKEKQNCCGCNACVQICPKHCINMAVDNEGFLYPKVDTSICVDCGLCEKVCPVINQNEPRKPLAVYAAKNNNDDIRLKSSSGGIFTALASKILSEGGVVFGARFNENWEVIHDYTETVEGLGPFRGSKYVQSIIGDNFKIVKQFLNDGRKVLFSGTPCQIAGLKKYLHKSYKNLVTVEVVCHGVPSPMIWRDYLNYKRAKRATGKTSVYPCLNELPIITNISFRDKTYGWKKYRFRICYASSKAAQNSDSESVDRTDCEITPFSDDIFMQGFLNNLILRPSCYHCAFRQNKSDADISLGDWWGISKWFSEFNDDLGISLMIVNSVSGESLVRGMSFDSIETEYELALLDNPCLLHSVALPLNRADFWNTYKNDFNQLNRAVTRSKLLRKKTIIINKFKGFFK